MRKFLQVFVVLCMLSLTFASLFFSNVFGATSGLVGVIALLVYGIAVWFSKGEVAWISLVELLRWQRPCVIAVEFQSRVVFISIVMLGAAVLKDYGGIVFVSSRFILIFVLLYLLAALFTLVLYSPERQGDETGGII